MEGSTGFAGGVRGTACVSSATAWIVVCSIFCDFVAKLKLTWRKFSFENYARENFVLDSGNFGLRMMKNADSKLIFYTRLRRPWHDVTRDAGTHATFQTNSREFISGIPTCLKLPEVEIFSLKMYFCFANPLIVCRWLPFCSRLLFPLLFFLLGLRFLVCGKYAFGVWCVSLLFS